MERVKGKETSEEKERKKVWMGVINIIPLGLALYAACPEARMKGVSTGSRFSAGRSNFDLLLRWTLRP